MRWDFLLFFASLAVTAIGGEWGTYIGVAGMAVFGIHGIFAALPNQKARNMATILGLIASSTVFVVVLTLYLRPTWFGIAVKDTPKITESPKQQENTDEALIERTTALAAELRIYDARESQIQSASLLSQPRINPSMTEEEKTRIWNENTAAILKLRTEEVIEFRNRFRPEVLRLRDELLFRIKMQGKIPPTPRNSVIGTLEANSLAGPNPITDVADYLESLANLLRT
jgi:hypothetical protein